MLMIRVNGVVDPYMFPGFGPMDWQVEGGALYVTRTLANPKKVTNAEGKEILLDREAIAVFGLATLQSLLTVPDPQQQAEDPHKIVLPGIRDFSRGRRGPN